MIAIGGQLLRTTCNDSVLWPPFGMLIAEDHHNHHCLNVSRLNCSKLPIMIVLGDQSLQAPNGEESVNFEALMLLDTQRSMRRLLVVLHNFIFSIFWFFSSLFSTVGALSRRVTGDNCPIPSIHWLFEADFEHWCQYISCSHDLTRVSHRFS